MTQRHPSRRAFSLAQKDKEKSGWFGWLKGLPWFEPPLLKAPWYRKRRTVLSCLGLFLFLSFVCGLPWLSLIPALGLVFAFLSGNVPLYVGGLRVLYRGERFFAAMVVIGFMALSFSDVAPAGNIAAILREMGAFFTSAAEMLARE